MVQKSGDHQLRLVVYPIVYKVLYIPGGAGFLPSIVVAHKVSNLKVIAAVKCSLTKGAMGTFIPVAISKTSFLKLLVFRLLVRLDQKTPA